MNSPEPPRLPYRIPTTKETTRLAGQWKALSGKVKIGVVAGGVLSLGAVGAMANPLTSTPSPQIPQFASERDLTGSAHQRRSRYRGHNHQAGDDRASHFSLGQRSSHDYRSSNHGDCRSHDQSCDHCQDDHSCSEDDRRHEGHDHSSRRKGHRHAGRVLLGRRRDRPHEYRQGHGLQDDGDRLPAAVARGLAVHSMAITAHP